MKALCVTFILSIFLIQPTFGDIINGYSRNINEVISELLFKKELKGGNIHHYNGVDQWSKLDGYQKTIVKTKIKILEETLQYYLLTEYFINEFKNICPDIYSEIDGIKNHESTKTDVFIMIVPRNHEIHHIQGATLISQDPDNPHICVSEFGKNSISVKVVAVKPALKILAHELGHVKFIVPNLNEYLIYCKNRYYKDFLQSVAFNHQASDMGSKCVFEYEKRYKNANKLYLNDNKKDLKSPNAILKQLKHKESLENLCFNILVKRQELTIEP